MFPCRVCVFQLIPVYEQGSQFQPSAIEMVDGQTSPPQLLTEADLISLMEKHGIGTSVNTHTDLKLCFFVFFFVCVIPTTYKSLLLNTKSRKLDSHNLKFTFTTSV